MCVWVQFYGGSKLRLTTVRHVTSIGPSITPVSTSSLWNGADFICARSVTTYHSIWLVEQPRQPRSINSPIPEPHPNTEKHTLSSPSNPPKPWPQPVYSAKSSKVPATPPPGYSSTLHLQTLHYSPAILANIANAGDIPSFKLFESERILAFLDVQPLSYGHAVRPLPQRLTSTSPKTSN